MISFISYPFNKLYQPYNASSKNQENGPIGKETALAASPENAVQRAEEMGKSKLSNISRDIWNKVSVKNSVLGLAGAAGVVAVDYMLPNVRPAVIGVASQLPSTLQKLWALGLIKHAADINTSVQVRKLVDKPRNLTSSVLETVCPAHVSAYNLRKEHPQGGTWKHFLGSILAPYHYTAFQLAKKTKPHPSALGGTLRKVYSLIQPRMHNLLIIDQLKADKQIAPKLKNAKPANFWSFQTVTNALETSMPYIYTAGYLNNIWTKSGFYKEFQNVWEEIFRSGSSKLNFPSPDTFCPAIQNSLNSIGVSKPLGNLSSKDIPEIAQKFRTWNRINHPDKGGDLATYQNIANYIDRLKNMLSKNVNIC